MQFEDTKYNSVENALMNGLMFRVDFREFAGGDYMWLGWEGDYINYITLKDWKVQRRIEKLQMPVDRVVRKK